MKKLIISLSIIAMIAAVFYSCTKEDEMTKEGRVVESGKWVKN